MNARLRTTVAAAVLVAGCLLPGTARAADAVLDQAKALYADASYDAALKALEKIDASDPANLDAQQYRILCLLALGRTTDAERVAETLISTAPTLQPSGEEFPPRFMSLFTAVRERVLPALVMKTFADARERYAAAQPAEAMMRFERVLALSADPVLADAPAIKDIKTLAAGFLELLRASGAAPSRGPASGRAAPSTSAALPAIPGAGRPGGSVATAVVPSVPVRQELPPWVAPDAASALRELQGALRVIIGSDGKVKSASIERPVHPAYDVMLLRSARNWLYKPATLDGMPVESERVIQIQLRPQSAGRSGPN